MFIPHSMTVPKLCISVSSDKKYCASVNSLGKYIQKFPVKLVDYGSKTHTGHIGLATKVSFFSRVTVELRRR